jgi:hypothetical protein
MQRRAAIALSIFSVACGLARLSRAQDAKTTYTAEQLDQMLAPIALYPDSMLSQMLMAATYPLEVVEAARWSKANPSLKGDAAVDAVKDKDWDVSVKSMVAFPQQLAQMNDHLDWTQKLGDAMLAQQGDVADSIQRLRAKAKAAGNLNSGPQQTVTTQGSGDNVQYVIAPTDPQVVYVPSYNPTWAYGAWPYPAYPPVYYPFAGALVTGFLWGVGFAAAGAMFGGWNWGGRGNSYVNVNVNRAVNIDNHFNRANINTDGRWQHDPAHRKGVGYRNPEIANRFNQNHPGADQRAQFRGRLQQPGGGQVANRVQPAQRPNITPQNRGQLQQNRGNFQHPSAVSGVNRGQQINRESARGQQQMNRAQSHPNYQPHGGGGGARAGGGGGARGGGGRR